MLNIIHIKTMNKYIFTTAHANYSLQYLFFNASDFLPDSQSFPFLVSSLYQGKQEIKDNISSFYDKTFKIQFLLKI